jgi:hypothetical protein
MNKYSNLIIVLILIIIFQSLSVYAIKTGKYYVTDTSLCPNSCDGKLAVNVHKACGVDGCSYCGGQSSCCNNAAGSYCGQQLCGNGCKSASWSGWSPSRSSVCAGETFTQTRTCSGGRYCWTPASEWCGSTTCSGSSTRSNTGTKYCCVPGEWTNTTNYQCSGNIIQREQTREPSCGGDSSRWITHTTCSSNQVCLEGESICNFKPTRPYITIIPNPGTVYNDLRCQITTNSTDEDGDYPISYKYEWYKNYVLFNTSSYTPELNNTLNSQHTSSNDVWRCRVTPKDNKDVEGPPTYTDALVLPLINGNCDPSTNLEYFYNNPQYNLCISGNPGEVSSNSEGWEWTCYGANGGSDLQCSAFQKYDAKCGTADNSGEDPLSSGLTLCENGYMDNYDSGSMTWDCISDTNGLNASCASNKGVEGPINLFCETNQANVNSVIAYIKEGENKNYCNPGSWSGNFQNFICDLTLGEYELCCGVNESRSYNATPDICTNASICECDGYDWNFDGDKKCDGCNWQVMEEDCISAGDEKFSSTHPNYSENCDYDDYTCDLGDESCSVDILEISNLATSYCPNDMISVYCNVSDSIITSLYLNVSSNSYNNIYYPYLWDGNLAYFNVIAPSISDSLDLICTINESISFSNNPLESIQVNIGGANCCSGYINKDECQSYSEMCDWCLSCRTYDFTDQEGNFYSGFDYDVCVTKNMCDRICDKDRCTATCSELDPLCNMTTCSCNINAGYDEVSDSCKLTNIRTTGFTEEIQENEDTFYYTPAIYKVFEPTRIRFVDAKNNDIKDDIIVYYIGEKEIDDVYLRTDDDCDDDENRDNNFECIIYDESSLISCNIIIEDEFLFKDENHTYYGCVKMADEWYTSPKEKFTLTSIELCPEGMRLCADLECRRDCTSAGNESYCGNNRIDAGEQCDGTNISFSCYDYGFNSGTIACNANCTLDTSRCFNVDFEEPEYDDNFTQCGNAVIEPGETCECDNDATYCGEGNYIGPLCSDLGFDNGVVSCNGCSVDTSQCEIELPEYFCGDGLITGGEHCDGTNLGNMTCEKLGYDGGYLGCNFDCTFNTKFCETNQDDGVCGTGDLTPNKQCECDDGSNTCDTTDNNYLGPLCGDLGFVAGDMRCVNCEIDTSECIGIIDEERHHYLDIDDDGVPNFIDPDIDGDGIPNIFDRFPYGPEDDSWMIFIPPEFGKIPRDIGNIDDIDGDGIPNHLDDDPYQWNESLTQIIRDLIDLPDMPRPRINIPVNELDCNFNGICDPWESCMCPDCEGKQNGCEEGLRCRLGVCTEDYCGDGIVHEHMGQECDDANWNNNDDCVYCRHAFCGDGYVHYGFEDCDDGIFNGLPGFCPADCQLTDGLDEISKSLVKNTTSYNMMMGDYTSRVKYYLLESDLNSPHANNPLYAVESEELNDYLTPNNCLESIHPGESCIQIWYVNVSDVDDYHIYNLPEDIDVGRTFRNIPINPLPLYTQYEMGEQINTTPTFRLRVIPTTRYVPSGNGVLRTQSRDDMTWTYNEILNGVGEWACDDGYTKDLFNLTCIPNDVVRIIN